MKVKELIELLQKENPEAKVEIQVRENLINKMEGNDLVWLSINGIVAFDEDEEDRNQLILLDTFEITMY